MTKKVLSVLTAVVIMFSLCACACDSYELPKIAMPANGTVIGEGGNMLIIGEYLYFVNGIGAQTDDNVYGTPVTGALMRVKLSDIDKLEDEDLEENIYETVVPKVIYNTSSASTGLLVHDNRIYFLSPSVSRDNNNAIESTRHDVMSVKFDGSDRKTHFTTEIVSSAIYLTVKSDKVYLSYLLSGSLYYVNISANKPERTEISDNVSAVQVSGNKLLYAHTVTFKDSHDKDMNQPFNELRIVDCDGAEDKIIANGRALIDGVPTDDYDENQKHGRSFSMVSVENGKLLYTSTPISSGPDGSYYYDIAAGTHAKLSWSSLTGILPYGDGYLKYDATYSYVRYITVDSDGIPAYKNLMHCAGVTLKKIDGDTLYYTISSVLYKASLAEMIERADAGKIITSGTKLHTTGLSTSVLKFIYSDSKLYFIGSDGYPRRATVEGEDEITEYMLRYIPEED